MTPADIRKLIAGYASGTLSEAERKVLFEAALHDQALFDALADEEALRELLTDSEVRGELLEALDEPENTGFRHTTPPLQARRAPTMQSEMAALPAQAPPPPPAAMPAGAVSGAPKQAARSLPSPPPPTVRWWRLPMYGGLAAALAVGIFVMFRPGEKQQVAQSRPAEIQTRQEAVPPQNAPQRAPETAPGPARKPQPAPSRPMSVTSAEVERPRAFPEPRKALEVAPFSGPAQADTALSTPPSVKPAESREQLRAGAAPVPPQQPAAIPAASPVPPPPPPPSKVETAAPIPAPAAAPAGNAAAMKSADAAPPFRTAGRFRYRVEQLGSDGNWAPAPAQLHAGAQLRLVIATPESGNVVASLGDNRTEILQAVAGQPVTLALSSSPGPLRIGLSLQPMQAEMAPRAKRLARPPATAGAAAAPKPSSDVEIRLEILP